MSRICKQTVPEMIVMSDTCFCEYTSHGHCGVLCEHGVDNDLTLANLGKQAVVAAAAGADFIAPSAAMDGQVQAIRQALDAAGFTIPRSCPTPPNLPLLSTARSVKPQAPR